MATLVTIAEQKIIPESDFFVRLFFLITFFFLIRLFLITPTTQDQTPSDFDYAGLVVVAVFKTNSKYVGITRSLATRRTPGIPKLLKCINQG